MKRRGFLGAVTAAFVVGRVSLPAAEPPARRVNKKTPGPAWDTMTRFHALLGGDAHVRHYVAPDRFCDQLEREMAPIAGPVHSYQHDGFRPRTRLGWRQVRIYRPDEAAYFNLSPPFSEVDCLYGYAPGSPRVLGPGWSCVALEYPHPQEYK